MPDDPFKGFESLLSAISKITSEDDDTLTGMRCPSCGGASFAKVSDVYEEVVRRLEDEGSAADSQPAGGTTDRQLLEKVRPPQRKSATLVAGAVAIVLGAVAFYVYLRFGEAFGKIAIVVTVIATAVVFLTRTRRLSDNYYDRRGRWNRLYMCGRCGQLVAP